MGSSPWSSLQPARRDIRMVVSDMDGTLLTNLGAIPVSFWPLLDRMRDRGITFVPASGRQYATLARMFDRHGTGVSYIAENGNLVIHDGRVLSTTSVDASTVRQVIHTSRRTAAAVDIGLVVCGLDSAYIERRDHPFVQEAEKYYARLAVVDDLTTVTDTVLKLAIYDFADAARTAASMFSSLAESHQVVVSGMHWIDIMTLGVDKGRAVRSLQHALGVTTAQTAVFGDYLNDLEMLDTAHWSFAMRNAHPAIRARARYIAPTNEEHGVIVALSRLLGPPPD